MGLGSVSRAPLGCRRPTSNTLPSVSDVLTSSRLGRAGTADPGRVPIARLEGAAGLSNSGSMGATGTRRMAGGPMGIAPPE